MSPADRDQYNTLLGDPPELPEEVLEVHEKFSKLHQRQGGGTLHPQLALMVVIMSKVDIETPVEKKQREAEEFNAFEEEERLKELSQKQEREASKREKVGAA